MNPYNFDDTSPDTLLSFLGQFMRTCDLNGVSDGVTMWLLPFITTKASAALLTIRLTPSKGEYISNLIDCVREDQERTFTYVGAGNYLLRSYTTDHVVAKASANLKAIKNCHSRPQYSTQYFWRSRTYEAVTHTRNRWQRVSSYRDFHWFLEIIWECTAMNVPRCI